MINYTIPLLLTLCGIGFAVIGVFFYEIGRQDAKQEYEAENAKLRALLIDAFEEFVRPYGDADDVHEYADRMNELGADVEA